MPSHQQQQAEQLSPHVPLQTAAEAGSPPGDTPADAEATHSLQAHLMTAATDAAHPAAAAGSPLEGVSMPGTADSIPDQSANGVMAEAQSTAEIADSMPAAEACDADADVIPVGHPPQMAVLASLDQVRSRADAFAFSLYAASHVKALLCLCRAVALSMLCACQQYIQASLMCTDCTAVLMLLW